MEGGKAFTDPFYLKKKIIVIIFPILKVIKILIFMAAFLLLRQNTSIQTKFVNFLNFFLILHVNVRSINKNFETSQNTSIPHLILCLVLLDFQEHDLLVSRYVKILIFRKKIMLYYITHKNLEEGRVKHVSAQISLS